MTRNSATAMRSVPPSTCTGRTRRKRSSSLVIPYRTLRAVAAIAARVGPVFPRLVLRRLDLDERQVEDQPLVGRDRAAAGAARAVGLFRRNDDLPVIAF